LAERIEDATQERQAAHDQGSANLAASLDGELLGPVAGPASIEGGLYGTKRKLRRRVFVDAPELEGRPVVRGARRIEGGGMAR
jgi:hypothetical protein